MGMIICLEAVSPVSCKIPVLCMKGFSVCHCHLNMQRHALADTSYGFYSSDL